MSRTLCCFEAELPERYRESEYCGGVGCFIRYSLVHTSLDPDGRQSEKLMHEEEAAVWLWYLAAAWPSQPALPGWPCSIEWIFSPVTGNKQWPGDVWGVDERGELVIVEGKMGDRRDPFEDFVRPDFLPPGLRRREFTAEELRPK